MFACAHISSKKARQSTILFLPFLTATEKRKYLYKYNVCTLFTKMYISVVKNQRGVWIKNNEWEVNSHIYSFVFQWIEIKL